MTTLLVDGHNIALRSLFAMAKAKPLATEDGIPTGALHTTINTLASYVKKIQPDQIMVCWDGGGPSWRSGFFPEYKAQRNPDRVSVSEFILQVLDFLDIAGVSQTAKAATEADDMIAAYWNLIRDQETHILSSDKDFTMLLDERTTIHHPGEKEPWTKARFEEEFGFIPEHMRLVMALMGDKIDGIPGVPGIGMKTAAKVVASVDANEQELCRLEGFGKISFPAGMVQRNLTLVDLTRMPPFGLAPLTPFEPTGPGGQRWDELLAFLDRFELNVVKARVMAGRLWSDKGWGPKQTRQNDREKGDGLLAF